MEHPVRGHRTPDVRFNRNFVLITRDPVIGRSAVGDITAAKPRSGLLKAVVPSRVRRRRVVSGGGRSNADPEKPAEARHAALTFALTIRSISSTSTIFPFTTVFPSDRNMISTPAAQAA